MMMIEAKLSRMIGTPAVLIFKKMDVVSRIASGVPMIATKLSDMANRIPAMTIEKTRIDERDVLIGSPGPSLLCKPLPTKKKIASTKVSWTTSSNSSWSQAEGKFKSSVYCTVPPTISAVG